MPIATLSETKVSASATLPSKCITKNLWTKKQAYGLFFCMRTTLTLADLIQNPTQAILYCRKHQGGVLYHKRQHNKKSRISGHRHPGGRLNQLCVKILQHQPPSETAELPKTDLEAEAKARVLKYFGLDEKRIMGTAIRCHVLARGGWESFARFEVHFCGEQKLHND